MTIKDAVDRFAALGFHRYDTRLRRVIVTCFDGDGVEQPPAESWEVNLWKSATCYTSDKAQTLDQLVARIETTYAPVAVAVEEKK